MGLLVCVDCGHRVSDRARACPACACPIEVIEAASRGAQVQALTRVDGGTDKAEAEPAVPAMLAAWHENLLEARATAPGAKRCERCGADVALDGFRVKSGDGYLCSDCQDGDDERAVRLQMTMRKAITRAAILVLVALTAVSVVYFSAQVRTKPAAAQR